MPLACTWTVSGLCPALHTWMAPTSAPAWLLPVWQLPQPSPPAEPVLACLLPPRNTSPVCPASPHPPDGPNGSSCHPHPGWAPWHHHPAGLLGGKCQHPQRQRKPEPCPGGDRGRHGPTSSQGLLLGMSFPAPTLLPWKCRGDLGGSDKKEAARNW